MEATKRPWTVEGPKHEHYHASIMGADGHLIVNIGDGGNGRDGQLANAALIVQAVNTFDQAREALKPFAEVGAYLQEDGFNELFSTGDLRISMADLKNAADTLAAMEATS